MNSPLFRQQQGSRNTVRRRLPGFPPRNALWRRILPLLLVAGVAQLPPAFSEEPAAAAAQAQPIDPPVDTPSINVPAPAPAPIPGPVAEALPEPARISLFPRRSALSASPGTDPAMAAAMDLSSEEILVSLAVTEFRGDTLDTIHRDGAQERLRLPEAPVESEGSIGRYLRRRPTLRGAWDLVNPFAPMPEARIEPAALAFETRRSLQQPPPRVFHDAVWHESVLRIW